MPIKNFKKKTTSTATPTNAIKPNTKVMKNNDDETEEEEVMNKTVKRPAPKKIGKPNTKKAASVEEDDDEDEELEEKPKKSLKGIKKPTPKKVAPIEEDDEDEVLEEDEETDEDEVLEEEEEDDNDSDEDDSDEDDDMDEGESDDEDDSDDDSDEDDDMDEGESEDEDDSDDDSDEDEVKPTKPSKKKSMPAKSSKKPVKKTATKKSKEEEEESSYEKVEITKGTRMCVPVAEDFSSTSRKMPSEIFYKNLFASLAECEVIDLPEDVKKNADKIAVASQVYMAVQNACIKTLVSDNSAVPFLNAKIYGKAKEGRVFPIIPGGPAKRETYQPPMISFVLTGNNFLDGTGLLYEYKTISEASAGGSQIDDNTFQVEVDSISAENGTPLWKKGDVIDISTGKKKSKSTKKTAPKKSVKKK